MADTQYELRYLPLFYEDLEQKVIYISETLNNEKAANALKETILAEFPNANVVIALTRGLCSFYAEKGGLMIGFQI